MNNLIASHCLQCKGIDSNGNPVLEEPVSVVIDKYSSEMQTRVMCRHFHTEYGRGICTAIEPSADYPYIRRPDSPSCIYADDTLDMHNLERHDISMLNLRSINSHQILQALSKNGINSIAQLILRSEEEILSIKGIGLTSLDIISEALFRLGLRLKNDEHRQYLFDFESIPPDPKETNLQ